MNYKDHLFFIAKCLTIAHEAKNKAIILDKLRNNLINWDEIVRIGTSHYVFPVLYLRLKEEKLLEWVPSELQSYMKYIAELNFERNQNILKQAKEIRNLLLEKNIRPVFIKGTGNLLQGLYHNLSERMIGDIDFIVPHQNYESTINLLKNSGYTQVISDACDLPMSKHYPRLHKKHSIAAVEVHREFTIDKYIKHFNYATIESRIQEIDKFAVLSYPDQLRLSIIAYHLNDHGKDYNSISLRTAYDIFLLSRKVDTMTIVKDNNHLKKDFNNFIALCAYTMNQPSSLNFLKNKTTKKYLEKCELFLNNSERYKDRYQYTKRKLSWKSRYNTLKMALYSRAHRSWLFKRIQEKEWQNAIIAELGLHFKSSS